MIRVFSISMLLVAGLAAAADAQPAAGSGTATRAPTSADARNACTTAMNADPTFAAEIVKVADEKAAAKRDEDTLKAHEDAVYHVEKNEKHVIYAYAAMWLVAAAFVLFLWRRQQALKLEISHLRRDLEAAASDTGTKETKS